MFMVDPPSDGSHGFAEFNQNFAFIHVNEMITNGVATVPGQVTAHELGHAQGLEHVHEAKQPVKDPANLMGPWSNNGANKWRLRRDQWNQLNP